MITLCYNYKYGWAECSGRQGSHSSCRYRQLHPPEYRQVSPILPESTQHTPRSSFFQVSLLLSSTPQSKSPHLSFNNDHNPYTPAFVSCSEQVSAASLRSRALALPPLKFRVKKASEFVLRAVPRQVSQNLAGVKCCCPSRRANSVRSAERASKTISQ